MIDCDTQSRHSGFCSGSTASLARFAPPIPNLFIDALSSFVKIERNSALNVGALANSCGPSSAKYVAEHTAKKIAKRPEYLTNVLETSTDAITFQTCLAIAVVDIFLFGIA